jgi:hypothetical protein
MTTNLRRLLMVLSVLPVLMAARCNPGAGAVCPSDRNYSDAFLNAVASELNVVANQAPHIVQMLGHYDITLQQIRYCIKQQKKKR